MTTSTIICITHEDGEWSNNKLGQYKVTENNDFHKIVLKTQQYPEKTWMKS